MDVRKKATDIVRTLVNAGYIAYFAGGWVRDYIMKHPSEDIDIATNAPPEVVLSLFPHTVLVGIEFGTVIVVIEQHAFEVTSFRRDIGYENGRKPEKIELATPEEDALRRDFTINGMFYDPLNDIIYDYVHGREDIELGLVRTIGDPHERFAEDRLRMIRAIRFASRFNFKIDEQTQQAILQHAETLLPAVAMERVWQEFNKMAKFPRFDRAVIDMHRLGLLSVIFPVLETTKLHDIQSHVSTFEQFSEESPVILYLMELFPETPLKELIEMCRYLRTSTQDLKIVEFVHKGKQLLQKEEKNPDTVSAQEWGYFYADKFFLTCFDAMLTRYSPEQRKFLYEFNMKRRKALDPHIQRIIERTPLVTAAMLQKLGIIPGKLMGSLLKEAENIAFSRDLHEAEDVIAILKESSYWPKN